MSLLCHRVAVLSLVSAATALVARPAVRVNSVEQIADMESTEGSITLLCAARAGCTTGSRVMNAFEQQTASSKFVQRLLWEINVEDEGDAMSALGAPRHTAISHYVVCTRFSSVLLFCVGASQLPFIIAWDETGSRMASWVALSPGAVHYGLQDLGGLLMAYESEA